MTTLLASSTATNATATEGDVKTFLTNMRTFMADLLGTDSANKAAVQALLGSIMNGKLSKSSAYTVVSADQGKVIDCTGTWTLSITSASTLGDGFCFALRNSGTGAITIDPSLSEQINGLTSYVIGGGEFVIIYCDGAGFSTVGGSSSPVGTVLTTAVSTAPVGWLLCYGQAISRTSYATLFNAIGTAFGAGDGTSTFNVPDLRGRVVAGKDDMGGASAGRLSSTVASTTLGGSGGAAMHALSGAEIPNHSHGLNIIMAAGGGDINVVNGGGGSTNTGGYGSNGAHNNTQPTIILNYIIKT